MAKAPEKDNDAPAATPADEFKTEREKGKPDPVGKSKAPEKVQTIEDQGIDPRTPYPTKGAS